jgi:hypothetical protein
LEQILLTEEDGTIFKENGVGDHRLKARVGQAREQRVRGSVPGAGGCNQHTGVEHNFHSPTPSTILISSGILAILMIL